MTHARTRSLAAAWLLFSVPWIVTGCLPFGLGNGNDRDAGPSDEWEIADPTAPMLVGSKLTISIAGPSVCSGGTLGIGATCERSTMNDVWSSVPEVATVEGFSASHIEVRAAAPGLTKISFEATSPAGESTSGAFLVVVAEAEDATLTFFTTCGEDTDVDEVAFVPGSELLLSASFELENGKALVGDDAAVPLALDPPSGGEISGTVNDGEGNSVELDLTYDTDVPHVDITLTSGKELARLMLATPESIDGWRVEPAIHNPNLGEYYVNAELTAGSRRICFDTLPVPAAVKYEVTFDTPEICDGGFGDTSVQAWSSFTIEPKLAGDCVVRLTYGALEEVLTIPVTL